MKGILFTLLLILMVACVPVSDKPSSETSSTEKPGETQEETSSAEETAEPEAPVTFVKCEDSDGDNPSVRGKVVIYYSDDSKQTRQDYCLKEDTTFLVEILCNGIDGKEKIAKCSNKCDRGVCI